MDAPAELDWSGEDVLVLTHVGMEACAVVTLAVTRTGDGEEGGGTAGDDVAAIVTIAAVVTLTGVASVDDDGTEAGVEAGTDDGTELSVR